jgi:putative tryptophan/tyrosine transport system substrate-binding protein
MRRREFISLFGSAVALPMISARVACAQQRDGMRRIAALMDTAADNREGQARVAAFREGLRQHGWTEGQNIQIDLRWGGGDVARTQAYAAELVNRKPDVIFAYAKAQLEPLSHATRTIPIVFCGASAPVVDGFVASFARPGGNITGFTQYEPSMVGKWLGALKEIAPALARVAIVVNPDTSPMHGTFYLQEFATAAASFHIEPITSFVHSPADIEAAMAALVQKPSGGLIVAPETFTTALHRARGTTQAAGDLWPAAIPGDRRADVLRPRHRRHGPPRGRLCRSHPARRAAGRAAGAGADQVRVRDQRQDREGARPDDSGIFPGARRRGDRVTAPVALMLRRIAAFFSAEAAGSPP